MTFIRLESSGFAAQQYGVSRLVGVERIGQLFDFTLDVACPEDYAQPIRSLLKTDVDIVFEARDRPPRRVSGIIESAEDHMTATAAYRNYRLRIVPTMWHAELLQTQDIMMRLDIAEIIKKKLTKHSLFHMVDLRLTGKYPKEDFIVQYGETDLAFLQRLCEHRGISLIFDQGLTAPQIVFTDHNGGFFPLPSSPSLPFVHGGARADVYELREVGCLMPKTYVMQDYNYETPSAAMMAFDQMAVGAGGGVAEYGAHYKSKAAGQRYAQLRKEEADSREVVYKGASGRYELTAGATFHLEGHPRIDQELLVVAVEHEARQAAYGHQEVSDSYYRNTFEVVPASRPYRPPRVTPKPRIEGFVTGVVEPDPKAGKTPAARIDEHGRYRVKFFFDTQPRGDWPSKAIRMMQLHGGGGHGMHFPLRPGVEVIVAFANGDLDRPIILGSIPNHGTPSVSVHRNQHQNILATGSDHIRITLRDDRN